MTAFAVQFFRDLTAIFLEASPYILLGFTIAAAVHVLLPVELVQRLLGRGRVRSVFIAALLGIPLPICSCAVVPTALALRKRGASKGATVSFLISTPETGEEAVALTWGLIGPAMAIFRPIAALVTAVMAGLAVEWMGDEEKPSKASEAVAGGAAPEPPETGGEHAGHTHDHGHAHEHVPPASAPPGAPKLSVRERLRAGFRNAFVELFDETSHWMLTGLIISALISVILPAEVVTRWLSSGPVPLLIMLLVGVPLYICASASTPIAASLMMKGLSPGAALVFLLSGPATNAGSLGIIARMLGRRVMMIYLVSIAVFALAFGVLLDALYPALGIDPRTSMAKVGEISPWIAWPSAVIFVILLLFSFRRVPPPPEFRRIGDAMGRFGIRFDQRFAVTLGCLLAAWWLIGSCFVPVPPGNCALLRRFGKPIGGVRGEGMLLKLPAPFDRADVFPAEAARRIELGFRTGGTTTSPSDTVAAVDSRVLEEEAVYLTGDGNLVSMKTVVQYRVTDPERYVYGFRDPESVLKLATLSEAVDVIAGYGIDRVYGADRGEVEGKILTGLQRRVESLALGIDLMRYGILDVHAPPEVHAAFRDVASSQEDKLTAINVAGRYLDETVNLARGEAVSQVEAARSDSGTAVLHAEGESQSLKARSTAFHERRLGTKRRLYLETMEEVLARVRKIVRPGWKGSSGIDLWLSNNGKPVAASDVIRGGAAIDGKDTQKGTQPGAESQSPPGEE